MSPPKILFLDAYDSFSNNIIALLREDLGAQVTVLKIDDPSFIDKPHAAFHAHLVKHDYEAVVAGPGPGDPRREADTGLISALWTLPSDAPIAVLGICLGFQSLVLAHGGTVTRLSEPRHGFTTPITHCAESIFSHLADIQATQYHSLRAALSPGPPDFDPSKGSSMWCATTHAPDLLPLAWDLSDGPNGPVLMSVRHRSRPFWGLQYHPESICTNANGRKVVSNWWTEASEWRTKSDSSQKPNGHVCKEVVDDTSVPVRDEPVRKVKWTSCPLPLHLDVADLVGILRQTTLNEPLLLESGTKNRQSVRPETGRFSIIGLPDPSFGSVRYWTSTRRLEVTCEGETEILSDTSMGSVFEHLGEAQRRMRAVDGPAHVSFWGGLMGYISYEAGLETINVSPPTEAFAGSSAVACPDVWFVAVNRSIVVDHVDGNTLYVQSLSADDEAWIHDTRNKLMHHVKENPCNACQEKTTDSMLSELVYGPSEEDYLAKVRVCQSHIRAGSSYELCLTDQTVFRAHRPPSTNDPCSSWQMYRDLRTSNPAPFGAYMHLQAASNEPALTLIGSSPERFLSWSRSGSCQFRPIKGTVRKAKGVTRQDAETILKSRKEQAENLMIVDLIRHDMHSVIGTGARVSKLMSVEEYETVYQLVSVIEGDLRGGQAGLDVLAASLPPGSMTGAPKKRSCELLREIESNRRRGLYSGTLGYLDVGGGGDFAVIIRSMVKWDDQWRIGAGGAVTALSVPEEEYHEMLGKKSAVFQSCKAGRRALTNALISSKKVE